MQGGQPRLSARGPVAVGSRVFAWRAAVGARKRCEHPVERTHEQSAKAARCKSPLPPSIAVRARMRSTQPRLRARAETVGEAHTASLRARDSTKHDVLVPLNRSLSHVIQQPWSSGRILACHAGDPSSILGGCKKFGFFGGGGLHNPGGLDPPTILRSLIFFSSPNLRFPFGAPLFSLLSPFFALRRVGSEASTSVRNSSPLFSYSLRACTGKLFLLSPKKAKTTLRSRCERPCDLRASGVFTLARHSTNLRGQTIRTRTHPT